MAETGSRNDPLVAFRFEVILAGFANAGFSECSGLQLEIEYEDYMEGGENIFVHKRPVRTKQSNLTLKRGIVDRELWNWFYQVSQGDIVAKTGSIIVRDPSGAGVRSRWDFYDALPVKWQSPDLNASQSTVAVETLELSYQRLKRNIRGVR